MPLFIEDPTSNLDDDVLQPKNHNHRPLSPDSALASSESSGGKQGKNKASSVSGGGKQYRQNFRENNDFTKNQLQQSVVGSLIRINPYEQFKPVIKKSARIQEKIALFECKKFVKSSLDQNNIINKSLTTSKINNSFPRPRPLPKKPKDFLSSHPPPPPSMSPQAIKAQALVQEAKAKHAEMFPNTSTVSPKSNWDFLNIDEEQNQDYLETVSLVSQKILNDNNNSIILSPNSNTGSSKWKSQILKEFATVLHLNNHQFVVKCRPKLLLKHENSHYDFGSEDLRNTFKISNVDVDSDNETENCSIPNKPDKIPNNKPNKISKPCKKSILRIDSDLTISDTLSERSNSLDSSSNNIPNNEDVFTPSSNCTGSSKWNCPTNLQKSKKPILKKFLPIERDLTISEPLSDESNTNSLDSGCNNIPNNENIFTPTSTSTGSSKWKFPILQKSKSIEEHDKWNKFLKDISQLTIEIDDGSEEFI